MVQFINKIKSYRLWGYYMNIREINEKDNMIIEQIIRSCLIEFGANREGFAWSDPELSRLSQAYKSDNTKYFIAEDNGEILGGCGIAPMAAIEGVCELQKMYLVKETRGTGIAGKLMATALKFAKDHYERCYLETLNSMEAANKFYKKNDFIKLDKPIIETEHFGCDAWYIKKLE